MQFRKSWMQEARDEGREIGKKQLLQSLLETRFSQAFNEAAKERLHAMSANRLETLAAQLLSASSLKDCTFRNFLIVWDENLQENRWFSLIMPFSGVAAKGRKCRRASKSAEKPPFRL